jgi:hypothetical protein
VEELKELNLTEPQAQELTNPVQALETGQREGSKFNIAVLFEY